MVLTRRALASLHSGFFSDLGGGGGVATPSDELLGWYFEQQSLHF